RATHAHRKPLIELTGQRAKRAAALIPVESLVAALDVGGGCAGLAGTRDAHHDHDVSLSARVRRRTRTGRQGRCPAEGDRQGGAVVVAELERGGPRGRSGAFGPPGARDRYDIW